MYQKQKKNLQKKHNAENALIGCGYWGTIIANNLLNLGYKNFYIYDSNLKNSLNLKKKFQHVNISMNYNDILKNSRDIKAVLEKERKKRKEKRVKPKYYK